MVKFKEYLELQIKINPDNEELISDYLFELGSIGCYQKDDVFFSYFEKEKWDPEKLKAFISYVNGLIENGIIIDTDSIQENVIQDKDWNLLWKKSLQSIHVLPDLIIKPTWIQDISSDNALLIEIDPQMAFGSGSHATTQLLLKLMKPYIREGQAIFDVGTGSGILSIAAAKLANCTIWACDIDAVAVHTAKQNCVINSVSENIHFFTGTIDCISNKLFDIVLANINRTVIITILPYLKKLLRSTGMAFISGILISDENYVLEKIEQLELYVVTIKKQDEWLGIVVRK